MKTLPDIIHPFWGKIFDSRGNGYSSPVGFSHAFFGEKTHSVYLGHHDISHTPNYIKAHPDEYYKPIAPILGEDYCLLDEFAATYTHFLSNIDAHIRQLQDGVYAIFTTHLKPQLPDIYETYPIIETREQHDEHISHLADIRLLPGGYIDMIFYYDLIPAPVFNVTFRDGVMLDPLGYREDLQANE
ncbi:hypothetical protein [Chitinophaga pinensis]|uniref:Uncharacterized protein n=1 Tax=Chitinophaga pinensis (strain ATCC 43595 / DSM 2588 / LMG 13176 / NBRC 15968 / NCIMB 11800 / UQM 2034) TaxID=485918 RepID=A0A979G6N9_CHIPD|nr:hypothetical protein [Chitinophaga pinensis]ACU61816.1 hypothetical protein Cpin_4369 [Chitinophaga pinensis DSM 2588]